MVICAVQPTLWPTRVGAELEGVGAGVGPVTVDVNVALVVGTQDAAEIRVPSWVRASRHFYLGDALETCVDLDAAAFSVDAELIDAAAAAAMPVDVSVGRRADQDGGRHGQDGAGADQCGSAGQDGHDVLLGSRAGECDTTRVATGPLTTNHARVNAKQIRILGPWRSGRWAQKDLDPRAAQRGGAAQQQPSTGLGCGGGDDGQPQPWTPLR